MENVVILLVLGFVTCSQGLIVPQELPSLLSLVYSNIPPIKKGTDSRLGVGFRLGNHADFQVMLEIGPQKNTKPIGNSDSSSTSKRNVRPQDYNEFVISQKQQAKKQQNFNKQPSDWLRNWSKDMRRQNILDKTSPKPNPNSQTVYTRPIVSEDILKQLSVLYQHASTESSQPSTSTEKPTVTT